MNLNKQLGGLFLLAPILLAGACTNLNQEATETSDMTEKKQRSLYILHTNDMHGTYMSFYTTTGNATAQTGDPGRDTLITFNQEARIGGFAYLASAVKKARSDRGANSVLLVDGGDTFSDDQLGNITKGEAMIRLMNALDYDLMALGNHDFDYGLQRTRELAQLANFPMRAANITDDATQQPVFGDPYLVKELNGIKVAVLTLGYRNTPKTGNPDNVKGLSFHVGQEVAQKYVPELRQKADIVVVLSHEGTAVDYKMAREVEGIDLIIGAHSHDILEPRKKIGKTYVVQAMSDAAVLGETELLIADNELVDVKTHYHWLWNDRLQPDREAQALIDELREPYLSRLQEKVVESKDVIGRQYKSESPFDRLVGNLLLEGYTGDVAIMPGVGYGISIKAGPVTSEDVYKLLPHPSRIVTLTMTGKQLKQTLEQSAENLKPDNKLGAVGGLIQTTGMRYELDLGRPIGQRITNVIIKNRPVNDTQNYRVVTHNGLLTGLHNYDEIGRGQNINRTEQLLTDFILQKLKEMKEVAMPANMGEVTIKR
ncbi:multifunctional 2',3'-cyclic-nucleotide 2'-phosphodiesterase/5'-nucleotidase/3'-nucleotidase [Pontibacter qinzhouensis]|uniref:Multifunctional 2',3'-cyclic-nucleotide 2'-phosphodiesterase/5'-nucleotidase/3'-nucleotidase n=1 Tax=Pontibacter qinzhouensis TaxID=2603253 RepID=A0A5C8K8W8_9BACT|nr:bifunctional UDP-sugar hydrolase/5'-nucleotidase [Pontibacter qinzhouensis]TXK45834.1 multifunctional 2',3'-cyclic-nucleotide 2'-phosphodiesterase/5'-nucleotidase/3'-nucleotidase [Pontibacter qinzhouensis]